MSDPAPGSTPRQLLIVEDHELLADTMALVLRQQGFDVHTASGPSSDAVVEIARRLVPVLVLLDLELGPPLGSGMDIIRPLVGAGAQVLMVTGAADRARLGECIDAGAIGVVSKAAGLPHLVECVRRAFEGHDVLADGERQVFLSAARARRRADGERLAPFDSLSPREQAVLARLVAGDSAETIAEGAFVSVATVRTQIRAILQKLRVKSQLAAVALARDSGWPPD